MQENNFYENMQNDLLLKVNEKRKVKSIALKVGIAYLIMLLVPRVASYIFMALGTFMNFDLSLVVADPIFQNMWQISVSIFMMILPAVILVKTIKKAPAKILSMQAPGKKHFLPYIFMGVGVCAFANIATNSIAIFLEGFGIHYSAPEMTKPDGIFGTVLIILSSAVTPALVEEFLMRGAVLGSTRECGEDIAVITSAVLFGLMHTNMLQIPFAFMVGLVLGFAVIKSGSIWTGIAIHFINNFMSVLLGDIIPFGNSEILKGSATALYFATSLALGFVGIYMLSKEDKSALRLEKGELKATYREKLGWFATSPTIIISIILSILMTANIV